MSNKIYQKVEVLANVAIIAVAILIGALLVQKFFFPVSTVPQPIQIKNGAKVEVPSVDWKDNEKTLVIYIKKGCKFCTDSMKFYKSLLERKQDLKTKIVFASSDAVEISKEYLNENGVKSDDVYQANLRSINVLGTPTLLLVNDKGEVSSSWVGRLRPNAEKEVINQL